jgi:hypothetical protein
MKTASGFALLAATSLATTSATADDRAVCLKAASSAQTFMDAHKLRDAREQLRVCAAGGCPSVVQTDCAAWLVQVEKALPTVVVAAKSGAGESLVDVKVLVDEQPFVTKLAGQSLPLDPGTHTFRFEAPDGTAVEQSVVVNEGVKNQVVSAVLGPVPPPPSGPPAGGGASPSPLRTVGFVVGGVGIAGLVFGGVMGAITLSDKGSAHCASGLCDPGTADGIKRNAALSDVGWIAGAALLAGGAALVLFAPAGRSKTALRIAPTFAAGGGQVVAGGAW